MLKTFVIFLAVLSIGSFSWGLKRHFRAPGGMPIGMQLLTFASGLAGMLFVILTWRNGVAHPNAFAFIILASAGLVLFWWSIETTRRRPPHVAHSSNDPETLYEDGPYAFVRHPFYLAYSLFWIGSAISAGGPQWLIAAFLVMWYYRTARTEEAHFLRSSLAKAYSDYQRRTGMIVPKLTGVRRL